jgi:hypothetical protein
MDCSSYTGVSDKKVELENFIDHFGGEGYINWSGRSNSSAMWPEPFHCHNLDYIRSLEERWRENDEECARVNFVPCYDEMDDG